MAWTTHPTVVMGQTWTAADHNTYVKGNLDTLFPYTAANQVAYTNSTTTLATVTSSVSAQFLRTKNASADIEFGSLIYQRQGNSTAAWFSVSTSTTLTNYDSTRTIIQCGTLYIPSGSTVTATFPTSYTKAPLIFISRANTSTVVSVSSTTTATFVNSGGSGPCMWFSIGE